MANHRENLLHVLAEASELEHNILCSYLYAAFSLKQSATEGLRPEELAAAQRWRDVLMQVSIEEMTHLAQVSNLLVAVGARPHFNRPNLPAPPGYHPARIVVKLAAFDLEALEHFIFLERPEEEARPDAPGFRADAAGPERPEAPEGFLMPRAPDYATIGAFYARLREALEEVCASVGEATLFCGPAQRQLRAEELHVGGLVVVTDLASARAALELIVVQGEGSRDERDHSHFKEFTAMREEFLRLRRGRPAFTAHRPAAANPVMRPATEPDRVHVTAPEAAAVLDAANAAYGLMLRCLSMVYELAWSDQRARDAVLAAAMAAMKAVGTLGSELTRMPARLGEEAPNAGMSFAMLRSTEGMVRPDSIAERLAQIAGRLPQLALAETAIRPVRDAFAEAEAALRALPRLAA